MKDIIISEAKQLIKKDGVTFTLDSLAKNLKISKKTIYKYINNKEEILKTIILEASREIKLEQHKIINSDIDLLDKIKGLLKVTPLDSDLFNNSNMYELSIYYPGLYEFVNDLFSQNWGETYKLMDQAKALNLLNDFDNGLFKDLYIIGVLHKYNKKIAYAERIDAVIDMLFKGIEVI